MNNGGGDDYDLPIHHYYTLPDGSECLSPDEKTMTSDLKEILQIVDGFSKTSSEMKMTILVGVTCALYQYEDAVNANVPYDFESSSMSKDFPGLTNIPLEWIPYTLSQVDKAMLAIMTRKESKRVPVPGKMIH